ncbi:Transcriptional regulator, Rrf2, partial [mine drainage metagenome]
MKATDRSIAIGQTRFLLAVRAIAWLAEADSVCSSSLIADSVHAHATFLRRLFAPLVRSGVVEVREGRVGGYALGRSPDQITLADIYHATRHFGDEP